MSPVDWSIFSATWEDHREGFYGRRPPLLPFLVDEMLLHGKSITQPKALQLLLPPTICNKLDNFRSKKIEHLETIYAFTSNQEKISWLDTDNYAR